jgi:hypothetical protein
LKCWWLMHHTVPDVCSHHSLLAPSCHIEPKGWGPLRLCIFLICICTSVDSHSQHRSCRSHCITAYFCLTTEVTAAGVRSRHTGQLMPGIAVAMIDIHTSQCICRAHATSGNTPSFLHTATTPHRRLPRHGPANVLTKLTLHHPLFTPYNSGNVHTKLQHTPTPAQPQHKPSVFVCEPSDSCTPEQLQSPHPSKAAFSAPL